MTRRADEHEVDLADTDDDWQYTTEPVQRPRARLVPPGQAAIVLSDAEVARLRRLASHLRLYGQVVYASHVQAVIDKYDADDPVVGAP